MASVYRSFLRVCGLSAIAAGCAALAGCDDSASVLRVAGDSGARGPSDDAGGDGQRDAAADPSADDAGAKDGPVEQGSAVEVTLNSQALTALTGELDEVKGWSAQQLREAYPTEFATGLSFDPTQALGYDLIQSSNLALSDAEAATFASQGVVISPNRGFATFSYGYHSIYADDLPVYITADSVLDALHRSYDDILKDMEQALLIPTLTRYLAGMRARLKDSPGSESARRDADFLLAMGQSLLVGKPLAPAFAGSFDEEELQVFFDAATKADGIEQRVLFGFMRRIDFSQYKPRGHYTDTPELERYFRAMMWLGRIDLRMVETLENGSRVLRRSQVESALMLRELMDDALFSDWSRIDRIITAFVGEHDYMQARQIDELKATLGITSARELADVADAKLAQAILDGHYGEQRIASHVMRKDPGAPELPLNASFALFGQRYVVDSHVFSQVVYDRVRTRVVPDPLDAAFAALGNNQALPLLEEAFAEHEYAGNLAAMRRLVDAHPASSWTSSLYTLWLGALRELSPGAHPAGSDVTGLPDATLPEVSRTETWGRRLLNTQLASWAQLRHDTLLYAKQSYTGFSDCAYPAAYVDPYPAFWAKLLAFAEHGALLLDGIGEPSPVLDAARAYFARFSQIVTVLHAMSEHQLTGMPHSEAHLAFINRAVLINEGGSGAPTIEGWYHQLLYRPESFSEVDLTIADVHTDPGGDRPIPREPSVLHVGTSYPRLMVVAVEGCEGPRAYAGPVFAYKEHLTDDLTRLNDEEWSELVSRTPSQDKVPDEAWMKPLFGRP